MNKQKFTRIILSIMVLVVILSVGLYFYYGGLKGIMLALAGGVLEVNLLLSLFLARKNMK